ncbi:membrane carboxypeptidase/penicillin-binding protein [Catenulispora sp. GAS73]|uniref:hypothetical protein n=1 Tax=Catenulispora sp. GAS73 TaxID=3156269 RepID=UPI0035170404
MSTRRLRTAFAAVGITIATATVVMTSAAAASADGVLDQWYPTYYDCQYAGDVYAQQGIIHNFSCNAGNGGWILTGWN